MPHIMVPYDASLNNETRTEYHMAIELALKERQSRSLITNSQRNAAAIIVTIPDIDEPLKKAAMSSGIGYAGQEQHAERVALREIIKEAMGKRFIPNAPDLKLVKPKDFEPHIKNLIDLGAKFFIFTERAPCVPTPTNLDSCAVFLDELLPKNTEIYYVIPRSTFLQSEKTLLAILPIAFGTLEGKVGPPKLSNPIRTDMPSDFKPGLTGISRSEEWIKEYLEEQRRKLTTTLTTSSTFSTDNTSGTLSGRLEETVVTTTTPTPEEILIKLGAELVAIQPVTLTNSSQESTLSEGSLPLRQPIASEEPPTAKPKPSPSSRHGSPGHHGSN